jgi:TolB protein
MVKITPKIGFIILGLSFLLLVVEIFGTTILGVASMGADSGLYIFNILYFIIALTVTTGILAPICGILNKKSSINISWQLFSALALILSIILFLSLGGLESVDGRWSHFSGGGSYIGSNPTFSSDGTKVIFSSPNTGHGDIYVMDIDGSNRKRLTTSKDYEGEPICSPDGSKICYIRKDRYKGHSQIYIMDINGNNQKKLTTNLKYSSSCSFSPDSKQIVFNSDGKICLINSNGSDLRCLNIVGTNPTFSPDGKSIYYYTAKDSGAPNYKIIAIEIWKLDVDTLKIRAVSTIQGELYEIKFSPNFKRIVYTAWQGSPQQYQQIFIANIDGTSIIQLTNSKELKSTPSFSWDGSKIIFLSEPQGKGGDIMIMNSDGSDLKSIGKIN